MIELLLEHLNPEEIPKIAQKLSDEVDWVRSTPSIPHRKVIEKLEAAYLCKTGKKLVLKY